MSQFVASCHGSVIEAGKRLLAAACCVFISVSPGIFRNTRVCTTACVCVCVFAPAVCVCVCPGDAGKKLVTDMQMKERRVSCV